MVEMDFLLLGGGTKLCCCCLKEITGADFNCLLLMKRARWKYPVWNVLFNNVRGGAMAIVCDECVGASDLDARLAIEINRDMTIYHPVKDLEDLEASDEMVKTFDHLVF